MGSCAQPFPCYSQAPQGMTGQGNHVKGLQASLAGGKDKLSQQESTTAEAQSKSSSLLPRAN